MYSQIGNLTVILGLLAFVSANSFANTKPVEAPYFYFLCNATSWQLNEDSRLVCDDPLCISYVLDFSVDESWMVEQGDHCKLLRTDTSDTWDETSEVVGAYVERPNERPQINHLQVPAVARFFGTGSILTQYPELGCYRIWVSRARSAFSIRPIDSEFCAR